jgi:hypothetical protein
MSTIRYLCEGFDPLDADDLMHAATLFALWKAQQTYGPKGRCSELKLHTKLDKSGAIFEAHIDAPSRNGETYRYTVLIDHHS